MGETGRHVACGECNGIGTSMVELGYDVKCKQCNGLGLVEESTNVSLTLHGAIKKLDMLVGYVLVDSELLEVKEDEKLAMLKALNTLKKLAELNLEGVSEENVTLSQTNHIVSKVLEIQNEFK